MTRFGYVMTTYFAMLAVGVLALIHPAPRLIECVWEPLCLATLNTPLNDASAQVFLRVLHDAFARRRADSDVVDGDGVAGATHRLPRQRHHMLQQRHALWEEAAIGEVAGDWFGRAHGDQLERAKVSGRP